jgi:hypothetical protein
MEREREEEFDYILGLDVTPRILGVNMHGFRWIGLKVEEDESLGYDRINNHHN